MPMESMVAEEYARQDAKSVVVHAQRLCDEGRVSSHEAEIVVNGDHLSPSWRALPGGDEVWRATDILPTGMAEDAVEAYAETLDELLDAWAGEHGAESLCWHEGNLWVCGEDFDWEGSVA